MDKRQRNFSGESIGFLAAFPVFMVSSLLILAPCSAADLDSMSADLVIANYGSASATLQLNKSLAGSLAFQKIDPDLLVGTEPNGVIAGDLNNDGFEDLVINNGGISGEMGVSFLISKGNGVFNPRSFLKLGYEPNSEAMGDFDGDGDQDILVSKWAGGIPGSLVQILKNNGLGVFSASAAQVVASQANSVAVGHFNDDAFLDGVVSNWGSGKVTIVYGNGVGGFLAAGSTQELLAAQRPQSIRVADFDQNGRDDIAFTDGADPFITVYLNQGAGVFNRQNITARHDGSDGTGVLRLADANNDAFLDLFTVQKVGGVTKLSVFEWDTNVNRFMTTSTDSPIGFLLYVPGAFEVADFNNDGKLDAAVSDIAGSVVAVYLGTGSGLFADTPKVNLPVPSLTGAMTIAHLRAVKELVVSLAPGTLKYGAGSKIVLATIDGESSFKAFDIQPGSVKIVKIVFPGFAPVITDIPQTGIRIWDFNADGIFDYQAVFSASALKTAMQGKTGNNVKVVITGKTRAGLAFTATDTFYKVK